MGLRSGVRALLVPLGALVVLLCPRAARACLLCSIDTECPRGFGCTPLVRAVDGGVLSACMPVDCLTDSDCAAGMRCVVGTATECVCPSDGPCPNSNCRPVNSCAPVWQAGCNVTADCGEGFQCIQNGISCSRGGCSTVSQCQFVPTYEMIACGADSDCPMGWSCLDATQPGGGCINPGGPAVIVDPDGGSAGPALPTGGDAGGEASSPSMVCRPPYWGVSVTYDGFGPVSSSRDAGSDSGVHSDAAATTALDSGPPTGASSTAEPIGSGDLAEASTGGAGAGADPAGRAKTSGCSVSVGAASSPRSWTVTWALALGATFLHRRQRKADRMRRLRVGIGALIASVSIACWGCGGHASSGNESSASTSGDPASCQPGAVLKGATYDMSKSRFAFGSTPVRDDSTGFLRWVGIHGVVAIESSGGEMGIMNAGAPETNLADWSNDPTALGDHVREYFVAMGTDPCQIAQSQVLGGSGGRTIGLARAVDTIPVVESNAFARLNINDQSTSEGFYWPTVPADVVAAARVLRDRLADSSGRATYKAKLPPEAQGDGRVVIHHTDAVSSTTFRSGVTYDVDESGGMLGLGSTQSFDADGNPVSMSW